MQIQDAKIDFHVHPFFELGNSLTDVVKTMEKRGIAAVGLQRFNGAIFPQVCEQAQGFFYPQIADDAGVVLPGEGKVIFSAREYDTRERIHLLTIGWSYDDATQQSEMRNIIDKALEHNALVLLDHPFIDNEFTKTAGHISEEKKQLLEAICKEYSGQIAVEWNGYCIPWMRAVLKYVVKGLYKAGKVPHDCTYHDVNKKAEELVQRLQQQGYNAPLIADTDLHARTSGLLEAMGTAHITLSFEGCKATEILASIKKAIFTGEYQNKKDYVSAWHLLEAFCFPVLFPSFYKNPRA